MKAKILRLRTNLMSRFRRTNLYVSMSGGTQDEWQKQFDEATKKGKFASDFIGMLTRLGFCVGGQLFFVTQLFKTNNFFERYAYAASALVCILLFCYLVNQVLKMVYIFLVIGTAATQRTMFKILLSVGAMLTSGGFVYGIYKLVFALSEAAGALK